ncbi:DUF4037 domain-containing protein [Ruminococcus sp. OA3]|uniref:DUF4037 domain-containing protein n=1 Tax=Ruminococcus sp. OA3 TaxID=2914164 RepID=UPI001F05655C|nr:DUF4037 domain-containing protein [Ruminococcus sp. OA3]MCH1983907.1 DUF4037 domain-containing protein [Ruminococcus sp. OA3]
MNGLELSRAYYEAYGRERLRQRFPQLFDRMTIGLAGEGSECFGFDDLYSEDHDFGPSFCVWLNGADYLKYGQEVQDVYDCLPEIFQGYPARKVTGHGQGRVGVLCTQTWYSKYTGYFGGPVKLEEWLRVPESSLATAVNGAVFKDPGDHFTEIRNRLLYECPEDIRIKRITVRAAAMAQAGQYNYMRCWKRKDAMAALLALSEFIRAGLSMVYLLNRTYAPYYKWMHRGIKNLPVLNRSYDLFGQLTEAQGGEKTECIIERICLIVAAELRRQGLSEEKDSFLDAHCEPMLDRIREQRIRNMPVTVW